MMVHTSLFQQLNFLCHGPSGHSYYSYRKNMFKPFNMDSVSSQFFYMLSK